MKNIKFNGNKISMPWAEWDGIQISPKGIHTSRGLFSPSEIDLMMWKASFYDRGLRPRKEFMTK